MSKSRSTYRWTAIFAVLALVFAACGDADDTADTTTTEAPDTSETTEAPDTSETTMAPDDEAPEEGSQYGGRMVIAYPFDLVSVDSQPRTQDPTTPRHAVFEQLVANDASLTPQPGLAESWDVSDDGLTWTFNLREGVNFHNGEVMTADDVVASWGRFAEIGARHFELDMVDEVVAIDDLTIEMRLSTPYGALPESVGAISGGWGIFPASIIEQIGTDIPNDPALLVGTGPYMVSEIIPEVSTTLVRFDDYTQRDGPNDPTETSYMAGPRYAYFDEIEIISIPDNATRAAALLSGDVDVAWQIAGDDVTLLDGDDSVDYTIATPGARVYWKFNPTIPPFDDPNLREAVRVGIDPEAIMAGYGPSEFWRINATPRYQEGQALWHDQSHLFERDMDRARQLVEDSDYDGSPVTMLVSPGRADFTQVIPVEQMLTEMGFTVEIQSVDTATFGEVRQDLTAWNIKPSGGGSLVGGAYLDSSGVDRTGTPWPGLPGGWDEILDQINNLVDLEDRRAAALEFYELHAQTNYEIWLGDVFTVTGFRSDIHGVSPDPVAPLWDMWREQ